MSEQRLVFPPRHQPAGAAPAGEPAQPASADDDKPITSRQLAAAIAEQRRRNERESRAAREEFAALKAQLEALPAQLQELTAQRAETAQREGTLTDRVKRLEAQLDGERKRTAEVEKQKRAAEMERVKDQHRAAILARLNGAGIKGDPAEALVNLLEHEGGIKWTADGKPIIAVKRLRAGDKVPSVEEFDDLAEGVVDWLKSPDADEWKPVAVPQARQQRERPAHPRIVDDGRPRELSEEQRWENAFARIGATEDSVRSDLMGHSKPESGAPKPSRDPRGRSEDERLADLVQRFGVTGE